jgi:arylsulfatase A-like enzyme
MSVQSPVEELADRQEREHQQTANQDNPLRSGLALLSVVALFSLCLEVELLQQIDSLRLYLSTREIAMEAGVALLLSLGMATLWWVFVLLVGQLARTISRNWRFRVQLHWYLWIAAPLSYLILDLFEDCKLELFPQRHAGTRVQIFSALVLICVCIASFLPIGWRAIQRFSRSRLVPIGWAHILLGLVAAVALWSHGVRLFHDYERPRNAAVVSTSPDIYFITIDALRAEDTSLYGYDLPTTPNLEKFAQRSFIFDHFYANSNFTTSTTTTIETGKLPWSHRVFQVGGFLRDRNQQENLAAELRQQGYYTAMISSNFLAAPFRHRTQGSYDSVQYASPIGSTGLRLREANLTGVNTQFTLGFSLVRGAATLGAYLDSLIWRNRYPYPAEDVFRRATDFLAQPSRSQPVFLWLHIFPPHDPYWVPSSYRYRFLSKRVRSYADLTPDTGKPHPGVTVEQLRAAYDEMILYADHAVGEYLDWLDRTGRLDRSIVIISADHGELFDHNRLGHGGSGLYNGVVHIPLLIHLPGQTHGASIQELSQQADLLPTFLDLIGATAPSWAEGISLKPALEGKSMPERYIFSMNLEPNRIFDPVTKGTVAVMDSDFKFVRSLESGKDQLYRYRTDQNEERNLVQSEPEVAGRMRKVLLDKINEVNQRFSGNQ